MCNGTIYHCLQEDGGFWCKPSEEPGHFGKLAQTLCLMKEFHYRILTLMLLCTKEFLCALLSVKTTVFWPSEKIDIHHCF